MASAGIAASAVAYLIDIFGRPELESTLVMTVLILIFGEITPKIVAKQNNYKMALFASYPIRILMFILKPIIVEVVWVVEKISGLWAKNEEKQPSVTEDELVAIIENVTENGIIDEESSELLQSAIEFSDITVEEILTPRIDMVSVDINDSIEEIIQTVMDSTFHEFQYMMTHRQHYWNSITEHFQSDLQILRMLTSAQYSSTSAIFTRQ